MRARREEIARQRARTAYLERATRETRECIRLGENAARPRDPPVATAARRLAA